MFVHPLLPLHVPSRPQPRRVESLAGPTLPGHYVCTPAAAQESFAASASQPRNLNADSDSRDAGGYFAARFPTTSGTSSGLWASSSTSGCPDTPGSCYSQNSEDDELDERDRLPAAPVRPRGFPPARAIPARKPKSRALADVRQLEAAAEGWHAEGGSRSSDSEGNTSFATATASTPSIYAESPEHDDDDDPMILAWTSPAPIDLAAAIVEVAEHADIHDHLPVHEGSPDVVGLGLASSSVEDSQHAEMRSQSHFNVALLASCQWGILPSMCKGVALL